MATFVPNSLKGRPEGRTLPFLELHRQPSYFHREFICVNFPVVRKISCIAQAFAGEIHPATYYAVGFEGRLHRGIVQRNIRPSSRVPDECELVAAAYPRPLKRLRSEGFIETGISIVSPKAAGRSIQALLATLERELADIMGRPSNLDAVCVTDGVDFPDATAQHPLSGILR